MLYEDFVNISEFEFNTLGTHVMVKESTPIGFLTIKEEQEFDHPSLRHFFVRKKHRTIDNARMLARAMMGIIMLKGYEWGIVYAPKDMPYIKKLIEYFWKKEPYNETDEAWFYLINTQV
jgi:hypothetical protein